MMMFCSMYTTVILAMLRHNAIKNPLSYTVRARQETSGSPGNEIRYIFPVMLGAVVFYSPKFFEFKIIQTFDKCVNSSGINKSEVIDNCTYKDYHINETSIRQNKDFILWYLNIFNHIITILIPFILLVYFNVGIYKGMKKFKRRRPSSRKKSKSKESTTKCLPSNPNDNNEQSIIIFGLVIAFISCHILRVILNVQEMINFEWKFKEIAAGCFGVRFWAMFLIPISEFLLLTNSSANFFIYYFFHKDFRSLLETRYTEMGLFCLKRSPTLTENDDNVTIGVQKSFLNHTSEKKHFQHRTDSDKTCKTEHIEMEDIHHGEELL